MENKSTILVVDDDPVSIKLLTSTLETAGYAVQVAPHGREALHKAHQNPPNLIISDVCMPEMDGFAFYKEIKKDKTLSDIPVVILTARSKMGDTFEIMGVDAFVTKPFDTKELLAKVESLVLLKAKTASMPAVELPQTQKKETLAWSSYIGKVLVGLFVLLVVVGTVYLVSYMVGASSHKKIPANYLPPEEAKGTP